MRVILAILAAFVGAFVIVAFTASVLETWATPVGLPYWATTPPINGLTGKISLPSALLRQPLLIAEVQLRAERWWTSGSRSGTARQSKGVIQDDK
jgi:hypothetical protein